MRSMWLGERLDNELPQEDVQNALPLVRKRFARRPRLQAAAELACLAGMRHALALKFFSTRPFAARPGTRFDSYYHSWKLPKKSGGSRTITTPAPFLKGLQRGLLKGLLHKASCHDAATGFRPGLSIAHNAHPHVGQRVVLNIDITNFFPSTRYPLIRRAINHATPRGTSVDARRLLADLCGFGGGLPIGAPTSPAIANLVLLPADKAIAKVAQRDTLSFTRYADDLTFSGADPVGILPFVKDVLKQLGYEIDRKKTNIVRRGRRQVVTGLVVNDKVSVRRLVRRRLRAAVHRATQSDKKLEWHKREMSLQELKGRIAFVGVVHPLEASQLARRLHEKKTKS